jgi:hypothetical protein
MDPPLTNEPGVRFPMRYGEPREGATLGMVRANIESVRDTGIGVNVFVRSVAARCDVCDDAFYVSECSDIRLRCPRHRGRP